MSKYLRLFETTSSATSAQDLVSPNLTYIEDTEKLLMKDPGSDDTLLEIVIESGETIIREKSVSGKFDISKFDQAVFG